MLTDVEDLPRINELAQSLQELKASGQLTKFKAVVGATQCETLDDVFDRLENLPQYCFETKIRDKDALVRDELEFVLGGKDADLIYKHLNREAYAEDVLKQYGARSHPTAWSTARTSARCTSRFRNSSRNRRRNRRWGCKSACRSKCRRLSYFRISISRSTGTPRTSDTSRSRPTVGLQTAVSTRCK